MGKVILAMGLCMLLVSNARAVETRSYGDIVSDCNLLADAQKLKSRARKDFVEWCNARALQRTDAQAVRYPGCTQRASQQGLRGEQRREFVDWCVDMPEGPADSSALSATSPERERCLTRADERRIRGDAREKLVGWYGEATRKYGANSRSTASRGPAW